MNNAEYYQDLSKFILTEIINKGKHVRPQEPTTSTRQEIVSAFNRAGWSETFEGNRPFRRSFAPKDNSTRVHMVDGKLYRHTATIDQIAKRKDLTRRFLEASHVPIPVGADFALDEADAARLFFQGLDRLTVTKPSNLGGSRGVTVGIDCPEKFTTGWQKASKAKGTSRVLVEEHIRGIELRLFVIGDTVVAAAARIQPFVVGNGKKSVSELVAAENRLRAENFRHRNHPISPELTFLKEQGYDISSTVPEGKVVFLNPLTVLRAGAINVEVTDLLSEDVKAIAVHATKAIPSLEIAGVDILAKDLRSPQAAKVIEVNTAPAIDIHRFPSIGRPIELQELMVNHFVRA